MKKHFETLEELKQAVDNGIIVHWSSELYVIVQCKASDYLIKCTSNNSCISLSWADNKTLNGELKDFYYIAS